MLKKCIGILCLPFKWLLIGLVYIYKFTISPLFPHTCRFYPSCSTYFILCLKEWGIFKGSWLGVKRICRCTPKGDCGKRFYSTKY